MDLPTSLILPAGIMKDKVLVNCSICLSYCSISRIRSLPCGHCFCANCTSSLYVKQRRPTCPKCRRELDHGDAHKLFLDFKSAEESFTSNVVEKLGQMGPESKQISVRRAGEKMSQAVEHSRDNNDILERILKALEDFKGRIIPLFSTVENQTAEIALLREDLERSHHENQVLETQCMEAEHVRRENTQLQERLAEAERSSEQALNLAEVAKEEVLQLRDKYANQQRTLTDLYQHKNQVVNQLDRHINTTRVQRQKNKALKRQVSDLKAIIEAREITAGPMGTTRQLESEYESALESFIDSKIDPDIPTPRKSLASHPYRAPQQIDKENTLLKFDFEALQQPGFSSDWQLDPQRAAKLLKRRKHDDVRSKSTLSNFPILLDNKGRPSTVVQLGPKRSLRV